MRKRIYISLIICLFPLLSIFAGDRAEFINLGFNFDSTQFMYGVYGIDEVGIDAYASVYLYDLEKQALDRNQFYEKTYKNAVTPGQNGIGALFMVLEDNYLAGGRNRISHLNNGNVLYYQFPGQKSSTRVAFRDFINNYYYTIVLTRRPLIESPDSNAALALTVFRSNEDGKQEKYQQGSLADFGDGVFSYDLKKVILSPNGKYLVMVVQTKINDPVKGILVRYQVRSIKLEASESSSVL